MILPAVTAAARIAIPRERSRRMFYGLRRGKDTRLRATWHDPRLRYALALLSPCSAVQCRSATVPEWSQSRLNTQRAFQSLVAAVVRGTGSGCFGGARHVALLT